MNERERQVLAVFNDTVLYQPAQVVRILNLEPDGAGGYRISYDCQWCPVLPPLTGQQISRVPPKSRQRVVRILKRLVDSGKLEAHIMHRGLRYYGLAKGQK